jgi:hypothetical protein
MVHNCEKCCVERAIDNLNKRDTRAIRLTQRHFPKHDTKTSSEEYDDSGAVTRDNVAVCNQLLPSCISWPREAHDAVAVCNQLRRSYGTGRVPNGGKFHEADGNSFQARKLHRRANVEVHVHTGPERSSR